MRFSHINNSNLNLLLCFQAFIEERSVSRAGQRLLRSQPAMSRALDQLRDMFKDELLIRTPNGYEATRRALDIYAGLEQHLPGIESLLRGKEFKPSEAIGCFRIAASDYGASIVLPQLMALIERTAPGVRLEIESIDNDVFRNLEINSLDLAFGVNNAPRPLHFEFLCREEFVCLVRKGHPLGNRPLTLKRYLEQKHVMVAVAAGRQRLIERTLAQYNYERDVQLRLPYYALAGSIVEQTDLVATIHKRLAIKLSGIFKVQIVRAPTELMGFNYVQAWHPRNDLDPAHKWIRESIKKVIAA
jgi:DNA-binding transcriptional LysR family regulator